MKPHYLPALLIFLCSTTGVRAQNLKPGLWQSTTTMQGGGQNISAAMTMVQKKLAAYRQINARGCKTRWPSKAGK